MTSNPTPSRPSGNILPIPMGAAIESVKRRAMAQWLTGERKGASPVLIGSPGIAKTSGLKAALRDVADELGMSIFIKVVTLNDKRVVDIRGADMPQPDPETGEYSYMKTMRPAVLPTREEEDAHDLCAIIVDEIPAATMDHVKAVAAPFLEYVFGDGIDVDPAKYFLCGTGNHVTDRSGASRLPAHFVNRVRMMHVETDLQFSIDWMRDPANGVPTLVPAFVEANPSLFMNAEVPAEANQPFLTIRSMVQGVQGLLIDFAPDPANIDPFDPGVFDEAFSTENAGTATALLAGDIGYGAARQFIEYGKVRHLLTPLREIIADPEGCRMPDDHSALFAQCSYIVAWLPRQGESAEAVKRRYGGKSARDGAAAMLKFVCRMRPDLRVPTLASMQKVWPKIATSEGFVEAWQENKGLAQATFAAR